MKDRAYHRAYSRAYYHKKRENAIAELGGKCTVCGSVSQLEIDHIDPTTKQFSIGKLLNHSKSETAEELQKCQVLCHDCHLEKTRSELKIARSGSGHPNFGKRGADFTFAKPVKCVETGECFPSATDAANVMHVNRNSLARVCRHERKTLAGMHFEYI